MYVSLQAHYFQSQDTTLEDQDTSLFFSQGLEPDELSSASEVQTSQENVAIVKNTDVHSSAQTSSVEESLVIVPLLQNATDSQNIHKEQISSEEADLLLDIDVASEIVLDQLDSDNISFLEKLYEKTQQSDIAVLALESLLDSYQFTRAKKFLAGLDAETLLHLDPKLHLNIVFNSFSLSSQYIDSLETLIGQYVQSNRLQPEDANRYRGLLALSQKNYDQFSQLASSFSRTDYLQFSQHIKDQQATITTQQGMPVYYGDALTAIALFNQGYFQLAKVLALDVLQQNDKYILPYQLLAYANFLTNSWDAAISYLNTLVVLDAREQEKYTFLIGVAEYWNKNYHKSVLKLSQVSDERYRLDAERYLALNYLELQQSTKLLGSWQRILGYSDLQTSDFYSYFYEVFFRPYAEGKVHTLYLQDMSLAQKYLQYCNQLFTGKEKAVCAYGKIGLQLVLKSFDSLESSLLQLVEEYPQGYLLHALGEYYLKQGNAEKAKEYLLRAANMTESDPEQLVIRDLLKNAF